MLLLGHVPTPGNMYTEPDFGSKLCIHIPRSRYYGLYIEARGNSLAAERCDFKRRIFISYGPKNLDFRINNLHFSIKSATCTAPGSQRTARSPKTTCITCRVCTTRSGGRKRGTPPLARSRAAEIIFHLLYNKGFSVAYQLRLHYIYLKSG